MEKYVAKVRETADYIRRNYDERPEILILAGTGLGDCVRGVMDSRVFEYSQLPHFPVSTVQGHSGQLVLGRLGGKSVVVMRGRFHLYEGYSPHEVTFPIRVMQALGLKTVIVTNAAGGLNLTFARGDIMVVDDHINLTGENPLTGPNHDVWGLRFPGMVATYDPSLRFLVKRLGAELGMVLREGVYAGLKGPSLETPAEMRFLRTIGADAVGFSTIQEVIVARHAGMRVLGLSVVTNLCDPDHPENATVEDVIASAQQASGRLETLIEKVVAHDTGI
ncbi:MAG: purine-nucleoside phosphorylase [Desulfobacteraceae bacterium]|jgi:purine-nucleoside phosphorylase